MEKNHITTKTNILHNKLDQHWVGTGMHRNFDTKLILKSNIAKFPTSVISILFIQSFVLFLFFFFTLYSYIRWMWSSPLRYYHATVSAFIVVRFILGFRGVQWKLRLTHSALIMGNCVFHLQLKFSRNRTKSIPCNIIFWNVILYCHWYFVNIYPRMRLGNKKTLIGLKTNFYGNGVIMVVPLI